VCYSSDGHTLPDHIPDNCDMVFVCEEFEGHAYDYLHSRRLRSAQAHTNTHKGCGDSSLQISSLPSTYCPVLYLCIG